MLVKKHFSTSNQETCPGCRQPVSQAEYLYRNNDFESILFKCPDCALLFARPVFIEALEDRYMEGVEDAEMFGSSFLKAVYINWFLRREKNLVLKKVRSENPKLLDIGCGTGWTAAYWQSKGFSVHGLEPSKIRAKMARENYGLQVYEDYVENFKPEHPYDVVVLRHSLEHFENPLGILEKIHELLAADGVLLLIVPNIDCLGRYLFGTDWSWVLPWHINFFNPKSLCNIVEKAGFHNLSLFQSPSPLYFSESLDRKMKTRLLSNLKKRFRVPVLIASAPFAIAGSIIGLGDNITLISRKQ